MESIRASKLLVQLVNHLTPLALSGVRNFLLVMTKMGAFHSLIALNYGLFFLY